MSRLQAYLDKLKAKQKTALIPYITAGDPNLDVSLQLMHKMVSAGADIIEVGVPFSDPMADGPVIQRASERALKQQVTLHAILAMVQAFRDKNTQTPIVLMGYLNPIEVMGYEHFAQAAVAAGVDGVLTVDMPPDEDARYLQIIKQAQLDPVFLLAPTTTEQRIQKITALAQGFVYYVSLKGVTGAKQLNKDSVKNKLDIIKKYTALPIGVGFGISDADTAAIVAQYADAVVVGSALVKRIEAADGDVTKIVNDIEQILRSMRTAIDAIMP